MRYVADLCIAALIAATCTVMAFAPLAACRFGDNITVDASPDTLGPSPYIAECCDLWRPWNTDAPGECLDDRCEVGVCRWLNCAVFWTYYSEACEL